MWFSELLNRIVLRILVSNLAGGTVLSTTKEMSRKNYEEKILRQPAVSFTH